MLTLAEENRIRKLEKRITFLEKERYTVDQIKQDMKDIIAAVFAENLEISLSPVNDEDQLKELFLKLS